MTSVSKKPLAPSAELTTIFDSIDSPGDTGAEHSKSDEDETLSSHCEVSKQDCAPLIPNHTWNRTGIADPISLASSTAVQILESKENGARIPNSLTDVQRALLNNINLHQNPQTTQQLYILNFFAKNILMNPDKMLTSKFFSNPAQISENNSMPFDSDFEQVSIICSFSQIIQCTDSFIDN